MAYVKPKLILPAIPVSLREGKTVTEGVRLAFGFGDSKKCPYMGYGSQELCKGSRRAACCFTSVSILADVYGFTPDMTKCRILGSTSMPADVAYR